MPMLSVSKAAGVGEARAQLRPLHAAEVGLAGAEGRRAERVVALHTGPQGDMDLVAEGGRDRGT